MTETKLKIEDFQRLSKLAVGHDGGMHVIAGEYHCMIEEARDDYQAVVLSEISSVSCL